jgi:transcription antitermination factor NusG
MPQTDCVASIPVESFTGTWWVAQTRPQYEQRLARDLAAAQVGHFLPLTKIRRHKNDRGRSYVVKENRPLFPGYLFLNAPGGYAPDAARRSIATIRIIPVVDQERIAWEIKGLMRAIGIDPELGTEPIRKGSRVRIIAGKLEGITGFVTEECRGQLHVQLTVEMMGRAIPAEMPADYVELI